MAIEYYSSIDLNKNELQNAVIQNAGTAPSSPSEGQIYYDSTSGDKALHFYNGSAWIRVAGQTTAQTTDTIASGDFIAFSDESETGDINNKLTVDNLFTTAPALLTEAAIADGDYIVFLDGGASGDAKKEAVHDLATLFAGSGLTATNSVIAVDTITSLGTITQDTVTFTSANANDPLIQIKNTTNDANGARLSFIKDKGAAGADNDEIGEIVFIGDDAAQTLTDFGKIKVNIGEADDSDEAGKMSLQVASSDGTTTGLTSGLVLTGHKTSDYVDVTLGAGSSSTVTIPGNLTVSGTTTTVNSTTVNLNDHNIILDSGNSTSAVVDGAGITIEGGSGDDATFTYNTTGPKFEMKLGSSYEDLKVDGLIAASLDISGNADIDGTMEADAYTVDGTALNEYIADTVGAMFSSNTETGITATYQDADNTIDLVVSGAAAATITVTDSTANTAFPVVFHDESNSLLDDTEAFTYNPQSATLVVANLDIGTDVDIDGTLETDALTIAGTAIVAQATTSAVGGVELATAAEVITGTDAARVVTADTLSAKSVVCDIDVSSLTDSNIVTITHNLGTADIIVQVYDKTTEANIMCDIARTTDDFSTASTSVVSIDFGTAPPNDCRALITSLAGATAGSIAYT